MGMGCQDYSKLPKRPAVGCRIRGKCHPSASSGSGNSGRRCGEEDRGTCQGCCGTLWEGQPWLVCTGKAPGVITLKGKIAGIFPMDISSFCLQQVFYDKGGQVAIPSSKRSVQAELNTYNQYQQMQSMDLGCPYCPFIFCFAQSRSFHVPRRQGRHVHPWHMRCRRFHVSRPPNVEDISRIAPWKGEDVLEKKMILLVASGKRKSKSKLAACSANIKAGQSNAVGVKTT